MKRLKLTIGILLIFFTGMAAGHLGTSAYFENKIYRQGPPALHQMIRHKITKELKLSDAQQREFERIITRADKEFDTFRQRHRPEVERIFNECFQKISVILDPMQQKRFEKIKDRFNRRCEGPETSPRPRRFDDRPPPPPAPPPEAE